ncbi:hypothetical protein BofuT4_P021710.1 [Botrytis cinerea T4]|uniref:Uncharacterized protein n=1 Tax=Botryotinia fuckeliana (strain T4) TaxID=999810 RepID=G2YHB8_BOTF4|nr:hypothetical protein BofuT4_P021710.1 [Botrytis cinerea T4]
MAHYVTMTFVSLTINLFPATIQKQNKILEYKSGVFPLDQQEIIWIYEQLPKAEISSDPVSRNGATTVPHVDSQGFLISVDFLFVTYKVLTYPLFKPAAKLFPKMHRDAKLRRSCRDRQIGTSEGLDMFDCL